MSEAAAEDNDDNVNKNSSYYGYSLLARYLKRQLTEVTLTPGYVPVRPCTTDLGDSPLREMGRLLKDIVLDARAAWIRQAPVREAKTIIRQAGFAQFATTAAIMDEAAPRVLAEHAEFHVENYPLPTQQTPNQQR